MALIHDINKLSDQTNETAVLFKNIPDTLSLEGVKKKDGRKLVESDLSLLKNQYALIKSGRLLWYGSEKKWDEVSQEYSNAQKIEDKKADFQTLMPGFVECHTHLVYAGNRQSEFELREQGLSYQEIGQQGGGIRSTVQKTREASFDSLVQSAEARLKVLQSQGVVHCEIKSGYGLDFKSEKKILEVIKKLETMTTTSTYLGLHSQNPDSSNLQECVDKVLSHDLEELNKLKLFDRVDIFVEKNFFTNDQFKKLIESLKKDSIPFCVHSDQLNENRTSALACELGAQSVDHAVHLSDSCVENIAKSNTTAVLLPGADFYLKEVYPNARRLIDAGARVALATDHNPGTSPFLNINWIGLLARLEMKMTLPEVIAAYTYNSARALGLDHDYGNLQSGAYVQTQTKEWLELFCGD